MVTLSYLIWWSWVTESHVCFWLLETAEQCSIELPADVITWVRVTYQTLVVKPLVSWDLSHYILILELGFMLPWHFVTISHSLAPNSIFRTNPHHSCGGLWFREFYDLVNHFLLRRSCFFFSSPCSTICLTTHMLCRVLNDRERPTVNVQYSVIYSYGTWRCHYGVAMAEEQRFLNGLTPTVCEWYNLVTISTWASPIPARPNKVVPFMASFLQDCCKEST